MPMRMGAPPPASASGGLFGGGGRDQAEAQRPALVATPHRAAVERERQERDRRTDPPHHREPGHLDRGRDALHQQAEALRHAPLRPPQRPPRWPTQRESLLYGA